MVQWQRLFVPNNELIMLSAHKLLQNIGAVVFTHIETAQTENRFQHIIQLLGKWEFWHFN
jgi:hypothetical protein